MISGFSSGGPGEVRQDQDYDGVNLILRAAAFLDEKSASQSDPDQLDPRHFHGVNLLLEAAEILASKSSTSHSGPDQGDQRQGRHFEGVNTHVEARPDQDYDGVNAILQAAAFLDEMSASQLASNQLDPRHFDGVNLLLEAAEILASNSSTSDSDPDQGQGRHFEGVNTPVEARRDQDYDGVNLILQAAAFLDQTPASQSDPNELDPRHFDGVNLLLEAAEILASNASASHSNPDQVDQRQGRHFEGMNLHVPPPVSTLLSNSSKSHSYPAQEHAKKNPNCRPGYTKEQEEAIRFLRDVSGMTWVQVAEAYNLRRYEDGTLWEPRTPNALRTRYCLCGLQNARSDPNHSRSRKSATSTSISRNVAYTKEEEDALRYLKEDCKMSWPRIAEVYNSRRNADGTPWVTRNQASLQAKYLEYKAGKSRTSSTSTAPTSRLAYTQEQEEAINFLKDNCGMTWEKVTEEYNRRCYPDGTLWESRTKRGLMMRYSTCKLRTLAGHSGGE